MKDKLAIAARLYARLLIARPLPFIVLPLALTSLLGVLLPLNYQKRHLKDELGLYTPSDSRAVKELRQLASIFPINDDDPFYAARRYDGRRMGYVVVTSASDDRRDNNDGDVLHPTALQAAMRLWEAIQSLVVEQDSTNKTDYPSLCIKLPVPLEIAQTMTTLLTSNRTDYGLGGPSFCVSNPLLELLKILRHSTSSDSGTLHSNALAGRNLSMSVFASQLLQALPSKSQISHVWSSLFGGLTFDPETLRVTGAKAILLPYALKHSTVEEDRMAERWELALADFLRRFHSPLINASWWTDESFASVVADDRERLEKLLLPCILSLTLFAMLASLCYSHSPLQPFLACLGIVSIAMAIASTMGFLLFLGISTVSLVAAVPLISFAMGVDNIFILMSSAYVKAPAVTGDDQRPTEVFARSAISISMTSLTNFMSFGIGCLSPFPAIQIFCAYSATAVLFTYIYQMTFFSASMCYVLGCRKRSRDEKKHRCVPIAPSASIYTLSLVHTTAPPVWQPYADGMPNTSSARLGQNTRQTPPSTVASFARQYGSLLRSPAMKRLILFAYSLYIFYAFYGCFHLEIGMEPRQLLASDSPAGKALEIAETHFAGLGNANLHVWMWNLSMVDTRPRRLWLVMQTEIELYEHTQFTSQADSWLHAFLREQNLRGVDIKESNFNHLIQEFTNIPRFEKFKRDVLFHPHSGKLDAIRITVRLSSVGYRNQTRAMRLFRRLADESDLTTGVYADFFNLAEQYDILLPSTLSSVAVVGIAVGAISFAFVPRTDTAVLLLLNVISINVGVVGFMPLLDIRLDFISMTAIVMSVGFSADYASHLAYHLSECSHRGGSNDVAVFDALRTVMPPIAQSASSTAIGVSFFALTNSYIFRSFMSVVLLAVGLSVIHSLLLMPIIFVSPLWRRPSQEGYDNYSQRVQVYTGERRQTSNCAERRCPTADQQTMGRFHF